MNILVLGGGGREHALAWSIAKSVHCEQLFIAPGNAGTAQLGVNVPVSPEDFPAVRELIRERQIELVVVGPEAPLAAGLVDFLAQAFGQDLKVIGPKKQGAQLEGSKEFAKAFMQRHSIPTAKYRSFTADNLDEGLRYLEHHPTPIVLKADGLAAGKGVVITDDVQEAQAVLVSMIEEKKFGEASRKVVVEAFLEGIELSVFVLTDGKDYLMLPEAKDYKRIGQGDTGLNTGGMGAVSPVPFLSPELRQTIEQQVVRPTVQGLKMDQIPFTGFLFIGLMITKGVPYVLEYNVRLGDPETQVVLPRITSDIVALFDLTAQQRLNEYPLRLSPQTAATVIAVSGGYPEQYEKGKVITGLSALQKQPVLPFHAGTKQEGSHVVTSGGRVLALTALGDDLETALARAQAAAATVQFDKKYYRKDIGFDL